MVVKVVSNMHHTPKKNGMNIIGADAMGTGCKAKRNATLRLGSVGQAGKVQLSSYVIMGTKEKQSYWKTAENYIDE